MTAVIEADRDKSSRLLWGQFANGRIKDTESKDLKCHLLRHTSRTDAQHKNKRMLVAESSSTGMTYVGKNFGQDGVNRAQKLMRHYVGIYDEKTGKMRVCPAELFHIQPDISDSEVKEVPQVDQNRSYVEKFGSLVEAFGSKRKKFSFEKKYRNKLDAETIQGVMAADAEHGKQQQKAMAEKESMSPAAQVEMIMPLPPCNKDAGTVEEAYPLSVVITEAEMDSLQSIAGEFFDSNPEKVKEWRDSEKYKSYILKHVAMLPMDGEMRWVRSKLLIYLHYMIKLFGLSPAALSKSKIFDDIPAGIKKKLFDNFTVLVGKTRCKPSRLKDRLAAYILLLCLHIDEFLLDTDDITRDLQIGKPKVQQILRAMGCKVSKKTKAGMETYIGKLVLPLDFPMEKSGARGKRGR